MIITGAPDSGLPCPIDWETASVGPGVLDLAALTAGEWREQERREMTAAYLAGSGTRVTLDDLFDRRSTRRSTSLSSGSDGSAAGARPTPSRATGSRMRSIAPKRSVCRQAWNNRPVLHGPRFDQRG